VAGRVPVEAAVEDRVQRARTGEVARSGQHLIQLVRVLAPDMAERDAGETVGEVGGQRLQGPLLLGEHGRAGAVTHAPLPSRAPLEGRCWERGALSDK